MNKIKYNEDEILSLLTKEANKQNIVLTYTHKLFFLRLLAYAEKMGENNDIGISICLSVRQLSEVLDIPLRTTIQSLNRLKSCGVLYRIEKEKTFPRSATITVINRIFYE